MHFAHRFTVAALAAVAFATVPASAATYTNANGSVWTYTLSNGNATINTPEMAYETLSITKGLI